MENKINWKQKLTSRKLWIALLGVVIGGAMAFGIEGSEIEEIIALIAGAATAISAILGYIDGEAAVDAARAKSADLAAVFGTLGKEEKILEGVELEEIEPADTAEQ